ncbi:MAG: hypothetical protein AAF489_13210 [Bacteroidota bacterium]
MILPPKKQLTMLLSCLVLLSLCWTSCKDPGQTVSKEKTAPEKTSITTILPDSLSSTKGKAHMEFFSAIETTELATGFFFNGVEEQEKKVVSLKLDDKQIEGLYQRLETAQATNAATLQVSMALVGSEDNPVAVAGQANFTALLSLVSEGESSNYYYPLSAFPSDLCQAFEQLYGWQDNADCPDIENCGDDGQINISPECACDLINNWQSIPIGRVAEQLYTNKDTSSEKNRIQYYTFDSDDTQAIYEYLKNLKTTKKKSYLYIHLGQLVGNDCVPLRMIIHLDDNPIDPTKIPARADDAPAYFEFARPCPPACGDQS